MDSIQLVADMAVVNASEGYSHDELMRIARRFRVHEDISIQEFVGKGNINLHTYCVSAGGKEYLLQKVNTDVFTFPDRTMEGMLASIRAQSENPRPDWVPISLVPTDSDDAYLSLAGDVWRKMDRIPNVVSHKSLSAFGDLESQLKASREVGRALAVYSSMTSSIDAGSLKGSLPGYRVTKIYFDQLECVLRGLRTDAEVAEFLPVDESERESCRKHFKVACSMEEQKRRLDDPLVQHYLALIQREKPMGMLLFDAVSDGYLRRTLMHGDTKIENFLFDAQTLNAISLVDLDTVMNYTWLADLGDMLRSLINVAGETETDLSQVVVNEDVFFAVMDGFLSEASNIAPEERKLLVKCVQCITMELGLRFLTDYLRGDTYFGLTDSDPADLNRTRGLVQLRLYEQLLDFAPKAEARLGIA